MFVALSSLSKIDDFYAAALPADGNKIKGKKTRPLKINVHKRDWMRFKLNKHRNEYKPMTMHHSFCRKVQRFVFKTLRICYASYIFYFMPYSMLWLWIPNAFWGDMLEKKPKKDIFDYCCHFSVNGSIYSRLISKNRRNRLNIKKFLKKI